MSKLIVTGQEQYILQMALANFEKEVSRAEFEPNVIFTKEFVLNHIKTLSEKVEKLQQALELSHSN